MNNTDGKMSTDEEIVAAKKKVDGAKKAAEEWSDTFDLDPNGPHTHSFICLHDAMSCGKKLAQDLFDALAPYGRWEITNGVKYVFPSAPECIAPNLPNIRSWIAIPDLQLETPVEPTEDDKLDLAHIASEIAKLIEHEAKEVGRKRVFVVGHGMGMAVALLVLLREKEPFGGLVGLNGWIPFAEHLKEVATKRKAETSGEAAAQDDLKIIDWSCSMAGSTTWVDAATYKWYWKTVAKEGPVEFKALYLSRLFDWIWSYTDPAEKPPPPYTLQDRMKPLPITATPVFIVHNNGDDLVPSRHVEAAVEVLTCIGFQVNLRRTPRDEHDLDFFLAETMYQELVDKEAGDIMFQEQLRRNFPRPVLHVVNWGNHKPDSDSSSASSPAPRFPIE